MFTGVPAEQSLLVYQLHFLSAMPGHQWGRTTVHTDSSRFFQAFSDKRVLLKYANNMKKELVSKT